MIEIQMKKPISPHLSIYKPQITSVFSILHRITGVYMFAFLIVLAIALFIENKMNYLFINSIQDSKLIYYILIFGISLLIFCLSYHICCGIRYVIWSCGIGVNISSAKKTAIAITIASLLMTSISIKMFIG